MKTRKIQILTFAAALLTSITATAQTPAPPYGEPISLNQARQVLAGAEAEARRNNWNVAIAILDSGGHIVLLQRLDSTQFAGAEVARQKAYSAVAYRRPTRAFQDTLVAGVEGLRLLKLADAIPIEGGLPLIFAGKVIGAIGVSGVTSQQDNQIAEAGANAL